MPISVAIIPIMGYNGHMTLKLVRAMMGHDADSVGYSHRDGCFVAKRVYFYRSGMTAEKFADAGRRACDPHEMRFVSVSDVWKAYPAESYFEVRFTFVDRGVMR